MIDIHSHILFGVDDGSRDLEESIEMLKAAKDAGFDKIIATPHVMRSNYNKDGAKRSMEILRPYAEEIGIKLYQGYEYNCYALSDDGIEGALKYCTEGTNTILLEFKSDVGFPTNWESIVMNIQREGGNIIVAHPERYRQAQRRMDQIRRTAELGCELQLDALSLIEPGLFNKTKKCAEKLLESGMVSWVASDAHSAADYRAFKRLFGNSKKSRLFLPDRYSDYSDLD